jgi:hypothetical protein
MENFIQEVNSKFMTDLAAECVVSREADNEYEDEATALKGRRLVMVGASHSARIANALEDMGAIVVDLSIPGWRISAESVCLMVQQLNTVLAEPFEGETYIIYQLFDNSIFLCRDEAGVTTLPAKGDDGRYHVNGQLVLMEKDAFRRLFTEILPLLRAGLDNVKVLLAPLLRYVRKPCCGNEQHVTNKQEASYVTGASLGDMTSWLNNLAFTRRIRNYTVVNPNELLGSEDSMEQRVDDIHRYYQDDPVHLPLEGYQDLSRKLVGYITNTSLKRKVDRPLEKKKKSAVDWAERRSDWVRGSDAVVHRLDTEVRGRGRGRPFHKYRGRGGGRPYRGHKFGGRGNRNSPY